MAYFVQGGGAVHKALPTAAMAPKRFAALNDDSSMLTRVAPDSDVH